MEFVRSVSQAMIRKYFQAVMTSILFLARFFRIWRVDTGECDVKCKGSQDGIYDAKFSSDNTYLAYTHIKLIHLWCTKRQTIQGVLEGHSNLVRGICFNPNGESLCSGNNFNI